MLMMMEHQTHEDDDDAFECCCHVKRPPVNSRQWRIPSVLKNCKWCVDAYELNNGPTIMHGVCVGGTEGTYVVRSMPTLVQLASGLSERVEHMMGEGYGVKSTISVQLLISRSWSICMMRWCHTSWPANHVHSTVSIMLPRCRCKLFLL